MNINRTAFGKAVAAAGVALAALGTASVAQAGSDVFFSIGTNIAPGVSLGVSNAPYYRPAPVYSPVYYQQAAPVYYQPAPMYYEPAPVYYQPAVYYAPPVVNYVRPWGHHHKHHYWR